MADARPHGRLICLATLFVIAGCSRPAEERPTKTAAKPMVVRPTAAEMQRQPVEHPTSQPTTLPSIAPKRETTWKNEQLRVTSQATPIVEGPAPLVYITQAPGTFRVVDRTTGMVLAEAFAPGRTLIRVDDRYGVVFGKDTLLEGPRPKGHKYAFYLQPDPTNVMRQGVTRSKPRQ